MEPLLFTMRLKPGAEAEYDRRHAEVWPHLVDELHRAGLRHYSIFRRGSEVIGFAECHPDVDQVQDYLDQSTTSRAWASSLGHLWADEGAGSRSQRVPLVWSLDPESDESAGSVP